MMFFSWCLTGFRGNVTVLPFSTHSRSISVTLNDVAAAFGAGNICGPDHRYTFSEQETPQIVSISPSSAKQGDVLSVSVKGVSTVADDNLLTIGGKPCVTASHTSISKTEPDNIISTTTTFTSSDSSTTITCQIPDIPPGHYRPLIHTAGRGWGFGTVNDSMVEVVASFSTPTQSSGSLRGGSLLSLPVTGLPANLIGDTHIVIGNTPCLLQQVLMTSSSPQMGTAVCITQPSLDDGYSSLIKGKALGYWNLQADFLSSNGSYISSESSSLRNGGTLGSAAQAIVVGAVSLGRTGISGNSITDQSAFFDSAYLRVQPLPEFDKLRSFSFELWLKVVTGSSIYRPIISSFGVSSDIIPHGFLLLLNPCNQLEFWVSEGEPSSTAPLPSDCSIITGSSPCPSSCGSGRIVYKANSSLPYQLPEGVWHVVTGPVLMPSEQEWVHVVFGFESQDVNSTATGSAHNCVVNSSAVGCNGQQVLYVNKTRFETNTTYHHARGTQTEIGGTSIIPVWSQGSSQLGHFTGYLDEISLFDSVLTQETVDVHHHYGSTEDQPISMISDASDGVGKGTVPDLTYREWEPVFETIGLSIDWDTANAEEHTIEKGQGVRFHWSG